MKGTGGSSQSSSGVPLLILVLQWLLAHSAPHLPKFGLCPDQPLPWCVAGIGAAPQGWGRITPGAVQVMGRGQPLAPVLPSGRLASASPPPAAAEILLQVRCVELWNPPVGNLLFRPRALPQAGECCTKGRCRSMGWGHPSVPCLGQGAGKGSLSCILHPARA